MNLATVAAAARHLGVSKRAAQVAASSKRITLVGGKVDLDTVAEEWARNTDSRYSNIGNTPARNGNGKATKDETFNDVRTRQKQLELQLMELRLAKERGELVPLAEVEARWCANDTAARQRVEMIADRLAAQIAAESDPRVVHALLTAELRAACEDNARGGA